MSSVKLIIAFVLALSLCSLSGPFSKGSYIPNLHLAKASPQLCQTRGATGACSEFWYPAGPAMNSALAVIFSDSTSEMLNLQSGSFSSIDFSDWPLSQSIANSLVQNPSFRVSDRSPSGFSEIEFNLDNNFWGCQFTFGSNACGIHLRQGLSHLIDKSLYVTNSASAGQLTALDDPEPSYNGLPSANPCSWDLNATQSGPNCIVGAPGGTAYHLSSASGIPGYPWMQRYDSVDFCVAAADIMMGLGAPPHV